MTLELSGYAGPAGVRPYAAPLSASAGPGGGLGGDRLALGADAARLARAGAEKARLDALKRAVQADIADDSVAELAAKRQLEAVRVSATQAVVRLAKGLEQLTQARAGVAAPEVAYATQLRMQAEAQLRSEYALRAALKAGPRPATPGTPAPERPARPVAPVAPVRPVVEGPKPTGAPVWRQPGAWVATADNFPAGTAIARLKAAGIKWVTLQVHDGTSLNEGTQRQLQAGFIQQLHAAGIQVGFWGVNRLDPEGEAAIAAAQLKQWGADFYIADAELEYKYTSADGSPSAEAYGRSQRFATAFRKLVPDLPAAVSSYGRTDMADIDWKAWRDQGFDYLPQAYLNEFEIYDPKLCMEAAKKSGWPTDRVHPTFGIWGGGQRGLVTAAQYADSLRAAHAGRTGWNVYLAEQMSEADWQGVTAEVQRGDLAR